MTNLLIILIVAAILFLIVRYLHKEKKSGKTCVGCPYSGSCSGGCSGCSGAGER